MPRESTIRAHRPLAGDSRWPRVEEVGYTVLVLHVDAQWLEPVLRTCFFQAVKRQVWIRRVQI